MNNLHHLLAQANCITLRNENNAVESISDNKDWKIVCVSQFHS